MFKLKEYEDKNLFLLRWTARILSVMSVAILLLFIFGEGSHWWNVTLNQMVGLLFFPVGLIVGLIVAWWKEFLGGAIAVGSVAAIYVVYGWLLNGSLAQGWWFLVFAIPGALFLAYGIGLSGGHHPVGNKVKI